jgi:hypothetical protein
MVFHPYINEMHGARSKIPSKKSRTYIHDVKFLAVLGAPYIYDISRLRVKKEVRSQLTEWHTLPRFNASKSRLPYQRFSDVFTDVPLNVI